MIAYFSVPEDVATDGVDAIAGASIVVKNGEVLGNVQYIAQTVQETIGGDLFRISYVFAFVAISLVVSCIIIGIIIHISVMERTMEIGILRALGASKRNISQVFNAETFIIGCCAGLLGIAVSFLLLFPINSIIERVSGISGITAQIPVALAVILVAISIVITLVGGLLPAKKAAKKDPVIALRTEQSYYIAFTQIILLQCKEIRRITGLVTCGVLTILFDKYLQILYNASEYLQLERKFMYDETQLKIIDATMTLIIEKGYSGATTKNIAKLAGVNECTIFRRFDGKKEIVTAAMELPKWNPGLSESDFTCHGDLEEDLASFSKIYMAKVTPQMVKVSIGLRSAELQGAALPGIMKVPLVFKKVLMNYFTQMTANGKMRECNVESISLQFIAMNFGFVFLDASFGDKLVGVSKEEYIRNSIKVFISGICGK